MHRTPRLLAVAAAAVLLLSCGDDGVSPLDVAHLDLQVVSVDGPTFGTTSEGAPTLSCDVKLRVVSNGRAGAQMDAAVFRWYTGADRSVAVDSSEVTPTDLASFFGGSQLAAGESAEAELQVSAGIPFGATLDIEYSGGSAKQPRHAPASFTCGPPAAKTPPPAVTVTLVPPQPGQYIEPGGFVTLHLTASSEAGLWRAAVGITGPCEVHSLFNSGLVRSISTDVTMQVPVGCSLDRTITVNAAAVDAFGAQTSVSTPTTWLVVDHTPPTLDAELYRPGTSYPDYDGVLGGDYFAGDSIRMAVYPRDNSEVRAVLWELSPGGPRDSVLFSGSTAPSRDVRIPVRLESGSFQLRVWARDASGYESAARASAVDGFHVYPTATLPVTTTELPAMISALAVDEPSGRLLVAAGSEVRIYSASTLTLERTVATPFAAGSIDVTDGGDTVFMTEQGGPRVAMVELAGATPRVTRLTKSDGADFDSPQAISVLSNGKVMVREWYTSNGIVEIDRATLVARRRTDAVVSISMVRSLDHRALFVADLGDDSSPCIQRYDAATDAFAACGTGVAHESGGFSTDAAGSRIARGYTVYDADGATLIRQLWPPNFIGQSYLPAAQLSADGTQLYVPYGNSVVRNRVSDGAILDRIPLPFGVGSVNPATVLVPTVDGSALFVASSQRLARVTLR